MNEDLLHYLWKFRLFTTTQLAITTGEEIRIIQTGTHNTDAGPDFFNARINIGDKTWVGNVEIHLKSSDWKRHKHHQDRAYQNVILHVVQEEDEVLFYADGNRIPTLELKNIIPKNIFMLYQNFIHSNQKIPCEAHFKEVDLFVVDQWLSRLAIERLEFKMEPIFIRLNASKFNWEQVFYEFMARGFGFNTNAEPFELLSKSIPHEILGKHKNSLFQIEALLFGQSGLNFGIDDYSEKLKKEYVFLAHKYNLKPLPGSVWKFLRLRPANFPTIRIAQFAALVHRSNHLFSTVLEQKDLEKLIQYFELQASDYWDTHYQFDSISNKKTKFLGKTAINLLLINVVVPFIFTYGKVHNDELITVRALRLLEMISPEKNTVTNLFSELGFKSQSALHSQSMLQLKRFYCERKKCLNCAIGNKILH